MSTEAPIRWNCSDWSPAELSKKLRELDADAAVELAGHLPQIGQAGLFSGLSQHLTLEVSGDVGDLLFFLGAEASIDVRGSAGDCVGHSMRSGRVAIAGNAARSLAAYATGGFVSVLGQAAERCGEGLSGADVFVRSRVGAMAGYAMRSGTLVLGNGCGARLGEEMTGGVIYIRGEVASKATSLRADRMKAADSLRLSLLLAEAGIKSSGSDFQVFRPDGATA